MNERNELIELLTNADLGRNEWERSTYEAQADALIAGKWAKTEPECDHDWTLPVREGDGNSRRCRCGAMQWRRAGFAWPRTA